MASRTYVAASSSSSSSIIIIIITTAKTNLKLDGDSDDLCRAIHDRFTWIVARNQVSVQWLRNGTQQPDDSSIIRRRRSRPLPIYFLIVMAILENYDGVQATIVVDGKDLPEYQEPDTKDETHTVTRYVEAIDDANFSIKILIAPGTEFRASCLGVQSLVDGKWVGTQAVRSGDVREEPYIMDHRGITLENGNIRLLRFNRVNHITADDSSQAEDLERNEHVGKIEVEIFDLDLTERRSHLHQKPSDNHNSVSEKAVKGQAVSHRCSLGPEIDDLGAAEAWDYRLARPGAAPASRYVFYYRSRAALKDLMIIPRTPSPVPLEDRPEEDLGAEEKTELIRSLKAKLANTVPTKKEVKRELEEDDQYASRPRPKRHVSNPPIYFELNENDTFTEVKKQKDVIVLDWFFAHRPKSAPRSRECCIEPREWRRSR
ncbi:hypothetical protein KCU98_g705, partial [Aureobasidium melanogenum]